ncbi:hypothetical protein RPW65_05725 [Pseudomonas sp. NyZ704]|nr:hypothetical protein RPW65_05725 [Pseudomonas sp. NyZ704]
MPKKFKCILYRIRIVWRYFGVSLLRLSILSRKAYVTNLLRVHRLKFRLQYWRKRHGLKLATISMLAVVTSSVFLLPFLQRLAGGFFNNPESLAALRSLLGGTGTALLGATTIAFSLIVFAMQTNVERMPHGLFRQLSSDSKLLSSFLVSFIIAIVVAGTSLIPDGSWGVPALVIAAWGIVITLLLFLFAYRRALQLINPIEQLAIMSKVARSDLRRWGRLADKAAILLQEAPQRNASGVPVDLPFNAPKDTFFKSNDSWSVSAAQAINYAISYAKRFADQGDYEVTDEAFTCIMLINSSYCAAKHGTFVASNPFVKTPGVTDGFINTSLEQLRQTMQAALARGDEQLAGSTLRAIGGLYGVYLQIEYSGGGSSKHHALLASGYLSSAVESVIPHNMPDLMMEGIRLMGRASRFSLEHAPPTEIVGVVNKIATLSHVGMLKTSHQPVTLTAFEQLAETTYDLLIKGKGDIGYPVRQLRAAVTQAATGFLTTPDTQLASTHQSTLGPYFSSTSFTSLRGKLTALVNELLTVPENSATAAEIVGNIETWANQIYDPHKSLFLLAVEKRSSFIFDTIQWAAGISELLNTLSHSPACSDHLREKLRRHAVWLISTLTWVPDDREAVSFVENYSLTESFFEAAVSGRKRDCEEFYECCKEHLIAWANKGGKHQNGREILEHSIKGLVALAIWEGTPHAVASLKIQLRNMLAREGAPSMELRADAAINLTRSANQLRRYEGYGAINHALAQQDQGAVRALLLKMADILAGEPARQ